MVHESDKLFESYSAQPTREQQFESSFDYQRLIQPVLKDGPH